MRVTNCGSLVLVEPEDDHELSWLQANVSPEALWWGRSLVVEPRYVDALLDGFYASDVE